MVRKMPARLVRERGQNLRPFMLGLMAGTLAESTEGEEKAEEKEETKFVFQILKNKSLAENLTLFCCD